MKHDIKINFFKLPVLLAAISFLTVQCTSATCEEAEVGKKIPAWKAGYLDIHSINTNTGESTLIIMPDGTQMLVDMGGAIVKPGEKMYIPPLPDESKRPGEWINWYIDECQQWTGNEMLDYVSITHFHGDHMGNCRVEIPRAVNGDWLASSVADILDGNKVGKLVDRAYPDYDYPFDIKSIDMMSNYLKCAQWHMENSGLQRERFVPGVADQFVMKYNAEDYPTFKIQNIAANGCVWTGNGTETASSIPDKSTFEGRGGQKEASPCENAMSTVFKISYGDFDYFGGGDVSHNGMDYFDWKDLERPIADVVGKVEVMKADHHGSKDANNAYILETLSPQVVLVTVWRDVQPTGGIAKYLTPEVNGGNTDLMLTYLTPETEAGFGEDASKILSRQGHTVVRVAPDGKSYFVYVLKDTDDSMEVTRIFGPYECN